MRRGQIIETERARCGGALTDYGEGPMRRGPSGDVTAALSRETQAGPGGGPA